MLQEKGPIQMCRRKQTFCAKSEETKFKIILVGDSSVGKTSLFLAFTDQDTEEKTNPSVTAVDFRLQPLQIQGEIIKLHIWDTAGQQRYRSLVDSFFKGCQGAIIVFDLSRKSSFVNATTQWFKMCTNRVNPSQIILIGNKADLNHEVSESQVRQWSSKNGVSYFLISVKNSQNIEQPFVTLSKRMIFRKREEIKAQLCAQFKQSPVKDQNCNVKLKENLKMKKKKGCC